MFNVSVSLETATLVIFCSQVHLHIIVDFIILKMRVLLILVLLTDIVFLSN